MSEAQAVNVSVVKEVIVKPKRAPRAKKAPAGEENHHHHHEQPQKQECDKVDAIEKLCSEIVDNPSEQPKQNKFDKNNVEDMKKLKALKDKLRRCEIQIAKYNEKRNELIKQLPQ